MEAVKAFRHGYWPWLPRSTCAILKDPAHKIHQRNQNLPILGTWTLWMKDCWGLFCLIGELCMRICK